MTKSKDTDQDSSTTSSSYKRKRGEHEYDGIEKSQSKQVKRSPELREAHVYFNANPTYSSDSSSVQSSSSSSSSASSSIHGMNSSSTFVSSPWGGNNQLQQPGIIFNINCKVNNSYYQTGTFHYSNALTQPMNHFPYSSNSRNSTTRSGRNNHVDEDDDDELLEDSIATDE